ncbi:hypothetical protein ACFQFR_36545 [Streptomyces goshikiensis]
MHEGDVSDKTFQGLHTRLKGGPVKEIKDYAWKSFGNAVRTFNIALARQRKRELLIGDDAWVLEESPMPVAGYPVEFDRDSVAASVEERLEMEHYRKMLTAELQPAELVALLLVKFDGYTSTQAAVTLKHPLLRCARHAACRGPRTPQVGCLGGTHRRSCDAIFERGWPGGIRARLGRIGSK